MTGFLQIDFQKKSEKSKIAKEKKKKYIPINQPSPAL
jgi:hypothetical protein